MVVGVALAAAISVVSAQESMFSTTAQSAAVAEAAAGSFSTELVAAPVAPSPAGTFSGEGGAALASEDGPKLDVALAGDEAAAVAQAPPASTGSTEAAATTQPALISQRDWSDGYKTVVECTGNVVRTCQANVYGPNGEFILGRTINPNGEGADCSGPCLDSTGAQLDVSSVTRAQAAVGTRSQTHKIITSAGLPPAPATESSIPTDDEAVHLHGEGQ
ncbi:MAG TPA: hypothetical protein VI007_02240 [bacterium]